MQRRVLVRARNLASFRRALVDRALAGGPLAARRRAVIVPTRASAELLRQAIEGRAARDGMPGLICPDLFTRDEWLARLHTALPGRLRWLSRLERHVLFERAARDVLARRHLSGPPFHLRPGLVAAMLEFHDELKRRMRTVRRFARALFDELRVERGTDRGSDSLINQTCFLGYVFLAYARGVAASGGVDEHALRAALLAAQPRLPFDELVVAVADHPADLRGLWPADFDLIGRLSHLGLVEIVMTDEAHDAGFRERLEEELPGIGEVRAADVDHAPMIVVRAPEVESPVSVARDREEELREVVRVIRARAAVQVGLLPDAAAVVFHRPLPYLYLAQQVLADGGVPYQAFDALPLAAEPYAAFLDVVLTVARTEGARDAVPALLRSPLAAIDVDGAPVTPSDVAALERILVDRRATGSGRTLSDEVARFAETARGRSKHDIAPAHRAAVAAGAVTEALQPSSGVSASAEVRRIAAFLRSIERRVPGSGSTAGRVRRARAAVLAVLDGLAEALSRYDDAPRSNETLAAVIHHLIESQTFAPGQHHAGVHLVDAVSARFGEFTDVYLVGLVDTDWAERPRRNVFYAATLLKTLGWPQEPDQIRAQQAAFRDVLTLAHDRTRLSAFQLEGDTLVGLSTMIDAVKGLPTVVEGLPSRHPVFADELLTRPAPAVPTDRDLAEWLSWRRVRPPLSAPAYGGRVAARPAEVYRVSRVDRYVVCPFKYFAEHVLGLPEERDEAAGLTPLERGTLMHAIFERFYRAWQEGPGGAITADNLPEAERLFAAVADASLAGLPETDRTLERMRLVGSIVSPGVADRVFALEVAAAAGVVERLIESELNGHFRFPVRGGLDERVIEIRGKTDRIDVLDDGTLRVIDYKLGRMPDLDSSVQIGVYAHCARQWIEQRDGRSHPVSAASYLAFGDDHKFEGKLARTPVEVEQAVLAKAGAFATVVEHIEAGEFPPRPRTLSECQWCGFAGICRKEYRVEETVDDDTAEPV